MQVAIPKDDWTPAKLKEQRAWRAKMYAPPDAPKPIPDPLAAKIEAVRDPEIFSLKERMAELEELVSSLRGQMLQARQILRAREAAGEEPTMPKYKLADVIRVVAKYYNLTVTELRSNRRTSALVRPRHVAMYLCRETTLRSLPEIGRHLGGRDHTTILHGIRKIEAFLLTDAELCQQVAELEAMLQE